MQTDAILKSTSRRPTAAREVRYIKWFGEIGIEDVPLVGGKNTSLGEMYRELAAKDVKVPNGFAITSEGYRHFLCETGLDTRIRELLCDLDTRDLENLRQRGSQVRHAILSAELPGALEAEILEAYDRLGGAMQHPWTSRFAVVPRPKICRMRVLPASRRPT